MDRALFRKLRQFTKPLILIALLYCIFGTDRKKAYPKNKYIGFTLLALVFSFTGGHSLLYDHLLLYIMTGLIAFLLAHINYAIVFFTQAKNYLKRELPLVYWMLLALMALTLS